MKGAKTSLFGEEFRKGLSGNSLTFSEYIRAISVRISSKYLKIKDMFKSNHRNKSGMVISKDHSPDWSTPSSPGLSGGFFVYG
jgi:hypothetical protein